MIIIVGAGISGATLAERYASLGKKVLIVEKRNHIGGNCHDFYSEDGILVPLYGPHFFHTNLDKVWDYVNRFSSWQAYEHKVLSSVDGQLVPVPVNIETVNTIFNLSLQNEKEMLAWLKENTAAVDNPRNSEESAISKVGITLYEKMFKNYTKKQWDLFPSQLDPQVLDRIPVRTNFEDRYFTDIHQAMPVKGYTELFNNMLDNPNIEVLLSTDFLKERKKFQNYEKLFFTGRIDQFFSGIIDESLQYRSLRFEFETIDKEWYQEATTINFPNDHDFTRITEPKRSTGQQHSKTVIIREYPSWDGEPYYPVFNPRNNEILAKYQRAAKHIERENTYFVGRLANYRYFNMDAAFDNALKLFEKLES